MEQVCKWCGKEAKYFLPALGPLSKNWCCEKNRVFCPKYKPPDFALEAALRELALLEEIEERKRQEEEAARPRRLILANVGEEKMKPLSNWCDQIKAKEKGNESERLRIVISDNVGEEKMKPLSNWCDQIKAKEKGKQLYAK